MNNDHKEIFLQPECCAEPYIGRIWCEHDESESCDEGVKWTRYVRADLYEQLEKENAELKQERDQLRVVIARIKGAAYDLLSGNDEDPKFEVVLSETPSQNLLNYDAEVIYQFVNQEVPRIDAGGSNPVDPDLHHCEWTLYRERERIHEAANQLRQQAKESE